MPFRFSYVCDLLQRLDDNQRARVGHKLDSTIIDQWFLSHRGLLVRDDFNASPLLSTLLPEKRSDRVYSIQSKALTQIIARTLCLGNSRLKELERWGEPGSGVDLGDCVEKILTATPNACDEDVTVEEIDRALHRIASKCHFSSPSVQASRSSGESINRQLELRGLYRRVSARDAKWLTRLILKNYEPVVLDPNTVYRGLHPLLPTILKVQDDFNIAGRFLQDHVRRRGVTGTDLSRNDLALCLKPKLGVKVGRQTWLKGRSLKNCLDMSHGRISCEEKLDGEYCQIHVDLTKGRNCIQIFSKSGKDSTRDRKELHDAIRNSLKIGQKSCPLKTGCILEGELLVYDDEAQKILGFEKIRKHVSRSGVFIGTEQDSQPHPHEHLMIVYYDVLMVDDESFLGIRHSQRFKRLEELISCEPGRSQLVRRHLIDSDRPTATSDLRRIFAQCITERGEGLVLKSDDPYFNFSTSRRPYSSCCIKLKKEYIKGFGDVGDFAVVGARYDAATAKDFQLPNVKWTHFYIGCLENKDEVQRWKKIPRFVVTNVVKLNSTQLRSFISHVNPPYVSEDENNSISLRIAPGIDNGNRPTAIFTEPPVFDVRSFKFERAGNTDFLSPRFPMVNKIQFDRTYEDVISFAELQDIARLENGRPDEPDSQELLAWVGALEQAEPQRMHPESLSQTTTISTISTARTATTASSSSPSQPENDHLPPVPESPVPAVPPTTGVPGHDVSPLTPPRSSAIEPPDTEPPKAFYESGESKKRPPSSPLKTPRRSKAPRIAPTGVLDRPNPTREALGDITHSSQSRDNAATGTTSRRLVRIHSFYMPSLENQPSTVSLSGLSTTTAASASFRTAPESCPEPVTGPLQADQSSFNTGPAPSPATAQNETHATARTCIHSGAACPLRGVSFLLAPCIAAMPWLTEDLFSAHGGVDFATDISAWKAAAPASADPPASGGAPDDDAQPASAQTKPPRRRRFALVESRRKGAVDALFAAVERARLRRRSGRREWIPVFDWRVMEELTREEERRRCVGGGGGGVDERFDSRSKRSVWNRHWVGLA